MACNNNLDRLSSVLNGHDHLENCKPDLLGNNIMRQALSLSDRFCVQFDRLLKTMLPSEHSERAYPAQAIEEPALSKQQRRHSAGLMRVNHSGEVAAQALYQGQSLTAKLPDVREQMQQAAHEEMDHLAWCQRRLQELNSRPSLLNPVWYLNSLILGAFAGWLGDRWSLGFVSETEQQVSDHLEKHLSQLPDDDNKSRAVVDQMRLEEQQHQQTAIDAGAAELPATVKIMMRMMAKVMTTTAYWI